jgi:hypothetical protein
MGGTIKDATKKGMTGLNEKQQSVIHKKKVFGFEKRENGI